MKHDILDTIKDILEIITMALVIKESIFKDNKKSSRKRRNKRKH